MNQDVIDTLIKLFESDNPVTLIIGAGASVRAGIPTGAELVREAAQMHPHKINKLPEKDREDYGAVMAELPPRQRQKLIQPHLDKAELSWGHLALACLLKAGYINRVLTFNFDMVIEKALARVDYQIPSYDFGIVPTDRIRDLAAPSIIYLHGQSLGLQLLNSTKETQDHAEKLRPLIRHELEHSVVVVMGYSGTSDQAFQIIEEEYQNEESLYWMGYRKKPDKKLQKLLKNDYAEFHGDCDYDLVMMELAAELGCFPPKLMANPMDHVIDGLQDMAEFPDWDGRTADLKRVLEVRMKKTAEVWENGRTKEEKRALSLFGAKEDRTEGAMDDVTKYAKYWSLLREAMKLVPDDPAPDLPMENFDQAFKLFEEAVKLSDKPHEALNNWGVALSHKAQRLEGRAALDGFDAAIAQYQAAIAVKPDKHEALSNWGIVILYKAQLMKGTDVQGSRQMALDKIQQAKDIIGKAYYGYACALALTGQTDAALDELDECAVDGTLPNRAHLETDTDMDALRGHPRFAAILEKAA
ncbi:MAG: TPR end-of-group domain-containing protein [Planktomarina sp.]